ncbi:hypothetical protein [Haloferax gibbonsii]|uniref:hypothetical protein n=1 Tax=Haloferax gibbonsii TaxID=35746 RepID=UPI000A414D36|nr:hypothetical protein [Haloferax gibbonsii]
MDDRELLYDQLIRRVDNQIQKKERLDSKATAFLRTIFTVVGLVSSVLLAFQSQLTRISFEEVRRGLNADQWASQLEKITFVSEIGARIVTDGLVVVTLILISGAIYYIFIHSTINAYKVLSPTLLEPSPDIEKLDKVSNRNQFNSIYTEYENIIESNESKLKTASRRWNTAYRALPVGISLVTFSIMYGVYLLLIEDLIVILLIFGLTILGTVAVLYDRFWETIKPKIAIIEPKFDIPLLSFIAYGLVTIYRPFAGVDSNYNLIMGVIFFVIVVASLRSLKINKNNLQKIALRNLALTSVSILVFAGVYYLTQSPGEETSWLAPFAIAISALLLATCYSWILFIFRYAYEYVWERDEEEQQGKGPQKNSQA